jgi:hypothetical protein
VTTQMNVRPESEPCILGIPVRPEVIALKSTPVQPAVVVRGLCVNCDKLHSCTYTKPEGGVWFCEEHE